MPPMRFNFARERFSRRPAFNPRNLNSLRSGWASSVARKSFSITRTRFSSAGAVEQRGHLAELELRAAGFTSRIALISL